MHPELRAACTSSIVVVPNHRWQFKLLNVCVDVDRWCLRCLGQHCWHLTLSICSQLRKLHALLQRCPSYSSWHGVTNSVQLCRILDKQQVSLHSTNCCYARIGNIDLFCTAQAAPSMILVFLAVILCAVACKDTFSDEVHESYTIWCTDLLRPLRVTGRRPWDRKCLFRYDEPLAINFFPHAGWRMAWCHVWSCSRDNWSYTTLVAAYQSILSTIIHLMMQVLWDFFHPLSSSGRTDYWCK